MKTVNVGDVKKYLIDFYELEPEQVSVLLEEMRVSIKNSIKEIGESVEDEDYKSIEAGAHTLKGTLLNFGLVESAKISSRINEDARAGVPVSLIMELVDQLKDSLAEIIETVTE